jgi:hypothetical protein
MRIPVIQGKIKRRLLVNFRADPEVVQRLLPNRFRPKLHHGKSLVGICLIRLEEIRPRGFPSQLGFSSENAAHRIAVEWTEKDGSSKEGVFIPRRDTASILTRFMGGRFFPGEHHPAKFVVIESNGHIDFSMKSSDGEVSVKVIGLESELLPSSSCFSCLSDASSFFEGGSIGYSVTQEPNRLDGLQLRTLEWRVKALTTEKVQSSFFDDQTRFPEGAIEFDHALIMRNVPHEWHQEKDFELGKSSTQ